jgi:4-aminobutyrate aminotransferase-like enzyme
VGGTFAGNPVSCAAALAAIAILEDLCARGRPDAIGQRIHERMLAQKAKRPIIREVRGLGAMQAIQLDSADTAKRIIAVARDRGLLMLGAGTYNDVIRFLAPLSISDDALDEGLAIFDAALT